MIKALARPPGCFRAPRLRTDDVLTDEDFQLALYCCYELHYQGFAGVSDDWEWNPGLLQLRSVAGAGVRREPASGAAGREQHRTGRGAGGPVATDRGARLLSVGLAAAARDPVPCDERSQCTGPATS